MGGSKGGGGPAGTTTSVQDTTPWGPQQPYLTKIFGEAARLYDTNTPQYYPGTTTAGPNVAQLAAVDAMARSPEQDKLPWVAANSAQTIAGGGYRWANPANPIFGSLATTESPEAVALRSYMSGERLGGAGNPYTDALSESVISRVVPGIQARFISGGSLSSPEAARATAAGATSALAPLLFQQQQQEEQNQINATKQFGDLRLAASTGLSNAFSGEMNDMLRAIALAPSADAAAYAPYDRQLAAGTARQQWEQQAINDAVQRWNFEQELPYNRLNNYIGAVTGNYGGTSTLTQPYFRAPQPSILSQVGQGAGVIGSLGSLFGMFSDRRLKDDIKRVGKLDNGLQVYSYRYKDDPDEVRRIGVMADEVEDVHPEAVATLPPAFGHLAGMKVVDYGRATA
jgi:hypothetical protein